MFFASSAYGIRAVSRRGHQRADAGGTGRAQKLGRGPGTGPEFRYRPAQPHAARRPPQPLATQHGSVLSNRTLTHRCF